MSVKVPLVTLNNGVKIPQLGFGVYLVSEEETEKSVLEALKVGYRSIDTAHAYNNEKQVGEAIKKSGIPRNEIFVTSKLWPSEYGEGKTYAGIERMLKRLGLDYLDLVLLHQPLKDFVGAYKDCEKAYEKGLVKSIGISNFEGERYDKFIKNVKIIPVVNQIECHPFLNRIDFNKKLAEKNIKIESWYPIAHGDKELLENKEVLKIAKKYNKTGAQIVLRWHIEKGYIPLVKSVNPKRIKENISIFDFKLNDDDMKILDSFKQKKYFTDEMRKGFESQIDNFKPKYE